MNYNNRKIIILSGINLFQGGPLSIYYDCLDCIIENNLDKKYRIIAFVHKKQLFRKYKNSEIEFYELPKSRKSYFHRMYYEYIFFHKLSRKLHIYLWLSLHDMTPNVHAERLYTYCHNPSPFYNIRPKDLKYGINNLLFPLFYKWIYRINIYRATGIIVQQDWIRKEFKKMYHLKQIIVAYPDFHFDHHFIDKTMGNDTYCFIFPCFPRMFKNVEIICKAANILKEKKTPAKICLTLDGSENAYASELRKKYGNIDTIEWLGILPREKVLDLYDKTDCLIFPSKLETWGLPITEFKQSGKPIIAAELPYAHETVGNYEKAAFFDPDDADALASLMTKAVMGKVFYRKVQIPKPVAPFTDGWSDLFNLMLD